MRRDMHLILFNFVHKENEEQKENFLMLALIHLRRIYLLKYSYNIFYEKITLENIISINSGRLYTSSVLQLSFRLFYIIRNLVNIYQENKYFLFHIM